VVLGLEKARRLADAASVREVCSQRSRCDCAIHAGRVALDMSLASEVVALIDVTRDGCGARVRGLESEALARLGQTDAARKLAEEAIVRDGSDPFARYALAHLEHVQGGRDTVELAERAVATRRGKPAHLLIGLTAFHRGDLAAARRSFERMLAEDPHDVEATYNLALVAHRQDRYRDAREGYLTALRLRGDHLDARYNLALLAHAAGAAAEAKHHLQKLVESAPPDDPRPARLAALITTPKPAPTAPSP
jgi:tetratricopeptide (TPR) repeat protein